MGPDAPIAWLAVEMFATLLAPSRCAACDARVPLLASFCHACASTVERTTPVPAQETTSIASFVYGGAIARAIIRLKYERRPDLARPLGDLLWRCVELHAPALERVVVVPVPLHPSRLAERGFNQSALVGRRIARRLGTQMIPLALQRTRDTPRQATLDRDARIANVHGAFSARECDGVRQRSVLLVDDVRTTGATLEACTRVLLDAGANSVTSAVIARTGD